LFGSKSLRGELRPVSLFGFHYEFMPLDLFVRVGAAAVLSTVIASQVLGRGIQTERAEQGLEAAEESLGAGLPSGRGRGTRQHVMA
jgi:hypothetical protein